MFEVSSRGVEGGSRNKKRGKTDNNKVSFTRFGVELSCVAANFLKRRPTEGIFTKTKALL